jgi:polyhydroxyalkanoate depolymerase
MPGADRLAAVNELFHRIGKDYEKPEWGINEIDVDGERVPIVVHEEVSKPFCKLLRFKRHSNEADQLHTMLNQPFVLVVAPLSGHHATLLRDTVRTLLPTTACTSPTGWTRAWCRPAKASSAWTTTSPTSRSSSATSAWSACTW